MNLFSDEFRRQEVTLLFALSVVAPYAWKKLQQHTQDWVTLPPTDPKKKATPLFPLPFCFTNANGLTGLGLADYCPSGIVMEVIVLCQLCLFLI